MRRFLVLTDESAKHPFRASLPLEMLRRAGEVEAIVPWTARLGLTRAYMRSIANTYCAGFVATTAFFA